MSQNGSAPRREEVSILIVGAGPAGTAMAAHLGQLGVPGVLLVDKHDFPRDKTCGSGISPKGIQVLRDLGVWDEVEKASYRINGIRIVTPQGHESYQSAGDVAEAVVCHRRILDHLILKRALETGVRFQPNFVADKLIEQGGRVVGVVAKDGTEVRARYTVVAGGTHCKLTPQRPRKMIQAIMGWWDDVPFRPNHLEMIFDKEIVPYYGWLFPESATRVNIGITYEDKEGDKRNARELFQSFLDRHYGGRIAKGKQVGAWKGHPVAYSYKIDSLTAPGRITVGESGLLTNPATAEGIYQGMKSGTLAAVALRDIVVKGMSEDRAFAEYERAIKNVFLLSFYGGGIFRQVVKTPVLDWLVRMGEKPAVQSVAARVLAAL